jgi:hypothetical protein
MVHGLITTWLLRTGFSLMLAVKKKSVENKIRGLVEFRKFNIHSKVFFTSLHLVGSLLPVDVEDVFWTLP